MSDFSFIYTFYNLHKNAKIFIFDKKLIGSLLGRQLAYKLIVYNLQELSKTRSYGYC
jgi:hypothetical protein